MSGTIEKKITTKSDFEAGNILFITTPYWKDGAISMKQDRTDNKSLNTILHATYAGTSKIKEENAPTLIKILRLAGGGNDAYLESDILPAEYEIKYNFKMTMTTFGYDFIGAIGKFNVQKQVSVIIDGSGNYTILYYDGGGTPHFWNGTIWTTATFAYAGAASAAGGMLKFIKTSTDFTIEIWEAGALYIAPTAIPIDSIGTTTYQEHLLIGDGGTTFIDNYTLLIWDICGIYIDRYSEKPGAFSAIIDLGSRPIIPGNYIETYNQNFWDEEFPQEIGNSFFDLRGVVAETQISESFQLTADGQVEKCRFHIKEIGAIAAGKKVWAEIWTDDGAGAPSAIISGYTSDLIEATTIMNGMAEFTYTEFNFSSTRPILNKNTVYHIVLKADYAIDGTNYLFFLEEYPTTYTRGYKCTFDGATWTKQITYTLCFGIKLVETQLIKRKISYANTADYKKLNSKADFEGNAEVQSQIDTATVPDAVLLALTGGVYYSSGYIQNDIDLGVVPPYFCTFSADYYIKPVDTTLTFKVATSDDNSTWTAFTTLTMTQGYCDLTALGKHRYWRVKIEFATSFTTYTPEVYSWTIDFFPALVEFQTREKLKAYQYLKLYWEFETNNPLTSIELTEIYLYYLIAYELYIKRVKYKITSSGILADMELSSQ